MTKFKEGQLVKCIIIHGTKNLTKGKYYRVAENVGGTNNIFLVNDDNELEQFSSERFVEVEEQNEEPRCFGKTAKELKAIANKLEDIKYHEERAEYHTNQVKVLKDAIDEIL